MTEEVNSGSTTGTAQAATTDAVQVQSEQGKVDPASIQGKAPASTMSSSINNINREFIEKDTAKKAKTLGLSYVNVENVPINPDVLQIISQEEATKGQLIPFFRIGKKLRIALVDPDNKQAEQTLERLRKEDYLLNINLTSAESAKAALKNYQSKLIGDKKEIVNTIEEENLKAYEKEIESLSQLRTKLKEITSEEGLNLINIGAIKTGTTDIHFQPEEKEVSVRFRIDGILQDIFDISHSVFKQIANQIKYKSKLKLNIADTPQDGRYSFSINERRIDVRVSTLPTEYGETFVCRLLDSGRSLFTFEKLGFTDRNLKLADRATHLSHGMILVTGPTGSGKTTTLYTFLDNYNNSQNKLITLEDPIEYHINNVSQSQINEKRNYNFTTGLKAILRQDPDVIMIGEIRDLDTAETAAQAALTGHVLLSTLHTNSAVESVARLRNMGLPSFMIAPALHTIIGQRLVRRICPKCAQNKKIPTHMREEIESTLLTIKKIRPKLEVNIPDELPFPAENGCEECSHTGYKGRTQIVEVLRINNEMKRLILEDSSSVQLIEAARKNKMLTMREDGILKVLKGVTSMEEIHRTTDIEV